MRLSSARFLAVAVPLSLYELAVIQKTGSSAAQVGALSGGPSHVTPPPLLLPSLFVRSSPVSWRQELVTERSKPAESRRFLVGFLSRLPHVQVAVAAGANTEQEIEMQEREAEEDPQGDGRLPTEEESKADEDIVDPSIESETSTQADVSQDQPATGPQTAQEIESQGRGHLPTEEEASAEAIDPAGPDESAAAAPHGPTEQTEEEETPEEGTRRGRPGETFRDEYKPSVFMIDSIYLAVELDEEHTTVRATTMMRRAKGTPPTDLLLDGEDLDLLALSINGTNIPRPEETLETTEPTAAPQEGFRLLKGGNLVIAKTSLPAAEDAPFELHTVVKINPKNNLKLSGLFMSGGFFVTQCEAEGFRRITYYLDRPDVLTRFTVRVEADKEKHPVLLSNGNKTEEGPIASSPGRHFAVFHDPFPKPSYLFALLAGDLGVMRDTFTTQSGKHVALEMYSSPSQVYRLTWSLEGLKMSMKWDEETFGREYDLDVLRVGCVSDFNPGAMENKGLLIFNCDLLLADAKSTTDAEYEKTLSTVGHEYFHNWTGDRVTVRDWFQLTLKEGLTVFRQQLFMASYLSPAVQRVQDVETLVSIQFAEDDGPMSHPVRPDSYKVIDNFYTATVYEKGAEVVRMYYTLLGPEGFRKGMDLYFQRHDGHAVTCEDFKAAMADANHTNLDQFERWYSQAGTPRLEVSQTSYKADEEAFEITFRQFTPPTPGQKTKEPLVIPIRLGLLAKANGMELLQTDMVLEMTEPCQTFRIGDIKEDCIPSVLRDFSAPVKLVYPEQTPAEKAFLLTYDKDPVNKWHAAQSLATSIIIDRTHSLATAKQPPFDRLPEAYVAGLKGVLSHCCTDNGLKALILRLPEWKVVAQEMKQINPDHLHLAIRSVRADIAENLNAEMDDLYKRLTLSRGHVELLDQENFSRRNLRNTLLRFLCEQRDRQSAIRAYEHFTTAGCMTDKFAALTVLGDMQQKERDLAFYTFYEDSMGDPRVIDKWFQAQAMSDLPNEVERVTELLEHPLFSFTNPNRLRSLINTFAAVNYVHFHRIDGKGYELVAHVVLKVDKFNHVTAARLAKLLTSWRDYDSDRQKLMKRQLELILAEPALSDNVREVVTKALEEEAP